mgnify:CR=1 FL=1
MKIELWSVGKPHESYAKLGIDDFSKRITNYYPASWHIISPPKNAGSLSEAALKKAEATAILQQLDASDYLVLLDETVVYNASHLFGFFSVLL